MVGRGEGADAGAFCSQSLGNVLVGYQGAGKLPPSWVLAFYILTLVHFPLPRTRILFTMLPEKGAPANVVLSISQVADIPRFFCSRQVEEPHERLLVESVQIHHYNELRRHFSCIACSVSEP